MNIVYADVDGNVGYAMSGRLPVRAAATARCRPTAMRRRRGRDRSSAARCRARSIRRSGLIYSANNEIDRGFSGLITRDWTAGFRASRLRDQLSKAQGVDLDAMAALQNDRHSVAADAVLAGLDAAIKTGASARRRLTDAVLLEQLAKWDRVVDARPVVSLYEAFEDALWRRTFVDEMDEPLFLKFYEWAGAEKPAGLYAIIERSQLAVVRRHHDGREDANRATTSSCWRFATPRSGCRATSAASRAAAGIACTRRGSAIRSATSRFRSAGSSSRGPVPVEGDGTTVMRISWNRLTPFAAWEHPSWRQIFDVGQWDDARVAHAGRAVGPSDEPVLFRSERDLADRAVSHAAVSRGAALSASRRRRSFNLLLDGCIAASLQLKTLAIARLVKSPAPNPKSKLQAPCLNAREP